MSLQPKQSALARLGAVCVVASVIGGAFSAPAAWAGTPDTPEIIPRSDAPASPVTPDDSEPDSGDSAEDDAEDGEATPAPEESGGPETPAPAPSPSPTPDEPAPTPSETAAPSQPPSHPAPPYVPPPAEVPAQPAPAPHPPRIETRTELREPAARLGALLRLVPREDAGVTAPEPTDEAEVDGGPDVGGSAELGASVPAQDPTGHTDAVRVGSLDVASGPDLAEPTVWAPWAGALGVAAAAVVVLVLRGGRHLGR